VDATRRIELAAQFVGVRSRNLAAQLRQLAKSILPDRGMPEQVRKIIMKLDSWKHSVQGFQKARTYEYER
jgi:hypothetical protein